MVLFSIWMSFLTYTLQIYTADTQAVIAYEYGVATNQGKKSFMEDRIVLETKNKYPVAGVLDGHGGSFTVDVVLKALHEYATHNPIVEPTENAITNLFHATNNTVRTLSGNDILKQRNGSTASVAFIHDDDFYCAQLGDSVIIDHIGALVLPPHGLNNQEERQRAGEHNFLTSYDGERFGGQLLMTRAFGDFNVTKHGLIATPVIKKVKPKPGEFLIFATDGVSDEVPYDMIAQYVQGRIRENIDLSRIAHELIILAASDTLRINHQTKESLDKAIDLIKKMKECSHEAFEKNREFADIRECAYDNQAVVIVHRKS